MSLRRSAVTIAMMGLCASLVVITTPAVAQGEVVFESDFASGTTEGWVERGPVTLTVTDEQSLSGGQSLLTTGRTADWNGPALDVTSLFTPGVTYDIELHVRFLEGDDPGTVKVTVQQETAGTQSWTQASEDVSVTDEDWVRIEGTYLARDADELLLYVESARVGNSFYLDDVRITTADGDAADGAAPATDVELSFDFDDGTLQGWVARVARETGNEHTVGVTDEEAHEGSHAALVSDRGDQGDGLGFDFSDVFEAGATYEITAWVKMADGEAPDDIWLTAQTGEDTFATIEQLPGVTADEWHELTATYTATGSDLTFVYFETMWPDGGSGSFLVDTVTVSSQGEIGIEDDLASIHEFYADLFPVGVAIDERETRGAAADLLLHHYNQVTAENHMKPDAWYDGREFRMHEQAVAMMDFAAEHGLDVYGHVLIWHSQVPAWFFEADDGRALTDDPADQQLLRDRMEEHIRNIGQALHDGWGEFGGGNPLNAWDVVNEVISDSAEHDDGLRRSEWYEILGEEFIHLSYELADQVFNDEFAAAGSDRPVALFINDYNTEQSGKQQRYYDLVARMLDQGTPLDGVGHQFHLSLSTSVSLLDAAIERFQDTGLIQAVTELDVTVGDPVTDEAILEQGYYYRDAFQIFRDHADDLHAVTLWGLTDNRSWRGTEAPLPFDGDLRAKPAYLGIVDGALESRARAAIVFQGEPPVDADGVSSIEWEQLPLHDIDGAASFQLRWSPQYLTAWVHVHDDAVDEADAVVFHYDDSVVEVARDAAGTDDAHVAEVDDGYVVLARLPLDEPASQGDTRELSIEVVDGSGPTARWGDPGEMGRLTLLEELSYVEVPYTSTAPSIDGEIDDVWADAAVVTTDRVLAGGESAASGEFRVLWHADTLFVLAQVTDDDIDLTASSPWEQDSIEIFVDAGNARNGPYRYDDTQIRISADNQVSFGTGDEDFQAARVESATSRTDDGYLVEVAVSLLEYGGDGTFHGLDVQVNDGTDGMRTGLRNWADPTDDGWQSTARWGVARLVGGPEGEIQAAASADGRGSGDGFPWWVVALPAALAVLLVVAGLVRIRRRGVRAS